MPSTRALTPDDFPNAAALIRLAFSHQGMMTDPPSSALGETEASIAAQVARGGGGAVVDADGTSASNPLIGAVIWEEKDGGLYFGRLGVHPGARGRGIARILVATVEAEARRRQLPRLHASVRLVLHDNRRLFAALGFVETVRSAHPGYDHPTTVAIEKWL